MDAKITITVERSKGYSGKSAVFAKGYVAQITGLDERYGLAREFLPGKPDSDAPYRKAKCAWNDVYEVGAGLYEISEGGERSYKTVGVKDGRMQTFRCSDERAMEIARRLDAGEDSETARLATKGQ